MKLYLMQHGDAKSEDADPERPLSEVGKQETEKISKKLAALAVKPTHLFHSPKLRAKQTAEILSAHLGTKPEETEGLKPKDELITMKEKIDSMDNSSSVFLIGHLPHLEQFATLLITGNPESPVYISRYSAPLCLEKKEGFWRIEWYLIPEFI